MATYRNMPNGNTRADVRTKGVAKNKTFPSKGLAQAWATQLESNIKVILSLGDEKLAALPESQVDEMGGEALFAQLSVDLFAIRNGAKLEVINRLSKKELLQLSPQEIEGNFLNQIRLPKLTAAENPGSVALAE